MRRVGSWSIFRKKKKANSVHVVLPHLCSRLDNNEDVTPDPENVSIFECLVSTLDWNGDDNNVEILAVKVSTEARGSPIFKGACVDSGAQQSVIGERQGELYCNSYGGERRSTLSK